MTLPRARQPEVNTDCTIVFPGSSFPFDGEFMKSFLVSSLVLCPAVALATPDHSQVRTIQVVGKAVTKVVPDTVLWSVSLNAAHKDLSKAKADSDRQMKEVLSTVRALGVKGEDLQTGHLSVRKEYERGKYQQGSRVFKHYVLTRELKIKQRGTEKFDAFLTALVRNRDMNVSYRLSSSHVLELRAKTRIQAVLNAKTKAIAMAKALGAQLGDVLQIAEQPSALRHGVTRFTNSVGFHGEGGGASTSTFAPGSMEVSVSVGVEFALR